MAVILGASTSWIFTIVLLFVMTDVELAISSTAGPLLEIYYQATRSRAGVSLIPRIDSRRSRMNAVLGSMSVDVQRNGNVLCRPRLDDYRQSDGLDARTGRCSWTRITLFGSYQPEVGSADQQYHLYHRLGGCFWSHLYVGHDSLSL